MRAATFTTYINTKEEPGAYRALDKLADVAVQRYGTIAAAADQAARAAAGVLGGSGSAGRGGAQARDLKTLADAQRQIAKSSGDVQRAAGASASAVRAQGREARQAATHNQAFARSLQTTATALNIVQGPLGPLAGRVTAVANAVQELTGFRLGLAGVGAALFAIGRAGNQYTILRSRLVPFFDSQSAANRALNDAIKIAKDARAPLETVVELYGRLSAVSKDVAIDQSRVGRITELASKAATLSGGTRETQKAGLGQFLQGIGSNNLAGDELKSVKENTFVLAQAIAQGFKNADGSIGTTIGHLKDLGTQGKLTAGEVADALERSGDRIDKAYAKLPVTLAQAGTSFNNSLTVMVGRLDDSTKFTSTLAQGIQIIAENLRAVTALAVGFAAVLAGPRLVAGATAIGKGIEGVVERTVIARQAVKELDRAWLADLGAASQAAEARVAALNIEQAEIRETIALLERKRLAAQRDYVRSSPSDGFVGSSRLMKAAADEEKEAVRGLITEHNRLNIVNKALRDSYGVAEQASFKLGAATENVGKRMGLLRTVGGSLVGFLGGPWGIAMALAAGGLYLLATRADATTTALDKLGGELGEFDDHLQKVAASAGHAADAVGRLASERRKQRADDAAESLKTVRTTQAAQLAAGLAATDRRILGGAGVTASVRSTLSPADQQALSNARAAVAKLGSGELDATTVAAYLSRLAKTNPKAVSSDMLKAASAKGGAFDTIYGAEQGYNQTVGGIYGSQASRSASGKPKTQAQLAADAAAYAAKSDLEKARAEERQVRANGKQQGETDEAYIQRLGTAIEKVKQLSDAERAARKARAAGAAQAKREARDARQDALDAAGKKRDDALLQLNKGNLDPKSEEFLQKRIAILKTYDDEVNKIDASRAASNSATQQMISDAEAVAKSAARAGERRNDILGRYADQPKAIAAAIDQIDDLQKFVDTAVDGVAFIGKTKEEIAEISKLNPLGTGIYTQAMADADAKNIETGVRKPLADVLQAHERELEISRLVLAGREAEADALRTAYSLHDDIGNLSQDEYERLVRNAEEQQHINDVLASRERITSVIKGTVDAARDSWTQFLTDIPNGSASIGNLWKELQQQLWRVTATSITERLFAGADEKVRSLLKGRNSVDGAILQFNGSIGKAESATTRLATTLEQGATRIQTAFDNIEAAAAGNGASVAAGGGGASATASGAASVLAGLGAALSRVGAANDNAEIVVKGGQTTVPKQNIPPAATPSAGAVGRSIFSTVGDNLDKLFDKIFKRKSSDSGVNADGSLSTGSGFFRKLGDTFGTALEGAGQGQFASGIAKAIGIKQSSTGAAIGGAIGNFLPIPGGGFIGGLIGGTIGGLFQKPKYGTAQVSLNQWGEAVGGAGMGRGAAETAAAGGAATSVAQGINQIANALGATITGLPGLTIGSWDGKARVALTSTNKALHSNNFGPDVLKDFGKDGEQDAIAYAIRYSIEKGVISGISQASVNIIKSGQDLDQAIQKAVAIESIPKRLLQRTDPVRYAVESVNDEFAKLISYLKEGGATAEQFADAQKLYELERADAVKQATEQAASAIDDFLKDMTDSSSSPFNKKTTYENASASLNAFKADISAGKVVDQNDLLSAARNFEDASRDLLGSSQGFFDDFEMLRALLQKARDNAGITDVSTLPASPFATDSTVQAKLAQLSQGQIDATKAQTDQLSDKLDQVTRAIEDWNGTYNGADLDAIGLLPGFGNKLSGYA